MKKALGFINIKISIFLTSVGIIFGNPASALDRENNCPTYINVVTIDTGVDTKNKELERFFIKSESGKVVGLKTNRGLDSFEDQNGHGTHVASIIAKEANCVKIIPISYWDELNKKNNKTENFVFALEMSLKFNPRIVNISGGGPDFNSREVDLIREMDKRGILVVAAAGNNGYNIDLSENFFFPSSYQLKNVISVAAVNEKGELAKISNYGIKSVNIAAPGVDVKGFGLNGNIVYLTGTSQATAIVSGLAAKVLTVNPKLLNTQVKKIIIEAVDKKKDLFDKVSSGGVINKERTIFRAADYE